MRNIQRANILVDVLTILFLFATFSMPSLAVQQSEEFKIFQTDTKIIVDGSLNDWGKVTEFPVNLTPEGEEIKDDTGMIVKAWFTYDSEKFYAAVRAKDDSFEFPSRSWRYGDGLYLTFLNPYQGSESDQFITFGFSIEEEKTTKVVVNENGVYFPGINTKDVDLKILPNTQEGEIIYELSIPWKYLVPFRPFIYDRWGMNLIYVDRDQGKRKVSLLYPDSSYDTELSKKRKGAIFLFVNHTPSDFEIQTTINASHFYEDTQKIITCAINSPSKRTGWTVRYVLSSVYGSESSVNKISLDKGMNRFTFNLEEQDYGTGSYDVSLGVIDENESLRFTENHRFFVLNHGELESFQKRIAEIKKGDLYVKNSRFRSSIPTLEIRIEWIQEYMKQAPPFAEFDSMKEWYEEIELLFKNVDEGKPALFFPGTIGRLAHRSEIDGTLQPYSVYVPDNYDEKSPIPLFVTLHGSGVDEERTILDVARIFYGARQRRKQVKMIVMSPKARGLSDWYLGNSGKEVIECIEHIKSLYNIDEKRITLDGFSMGGYGAWRLSLLHPDLFKAVIIRSGAIEPPPYLKGENILDLLNKGKGLNFFVIHGDKDNAVPVENARKAVEKLKELGIKHRYVEVKGAAHGGYEKGNEILDWLMTILEK